VHAITLQQQERDRGGRYAACGEPAGDAPVDGALDAVDQRPGCLGRGGVEQVGADGGRRVDAEQEHEQRRHQRAAAHARQADEETHGQSGRGIK
jgi:hypothetical protein